MRRMGKRLEKARHFIGHVRGHTCCDRKTRLDNWTGSSDVNLVLGNVGRTGIGRRYGYRECVDRTRK